ncbi:hypothetical protein L8C07_07340 [Paenibacillus sp. CMAA1739]|uniref:hypothetical protein n=1 Tax=Paenibacillus ottowii TaxID=2315729 RepID=UPI002730A8FC|nr:MULTISPECIES: hypothetical protein [Paenibacillus]MDP1510339.1 hypothetical protein [Paenibacillus ottowii]MEC4565755.1 hypothetical protein [Paenibacillus sp. CMAA1739]
MDWVDSYRRAYNNSDIGPVDVDTEKAIESFFENVEFDRQSSYHEQHKDVET